MTGGSSGIGRAIVTTLLAEGSDVTTCGLRQDKLARLEADLGAAGRLVTQVCDVRDANAVRRLAQTATDRFGGIDGVVCNAGRGRSGGVLDAPDDVWRDDYEAKVLGMLHTVRAALPALRRSEHPRVVVIGSATASRPHPELAAVSASRAALLNVAALLAAELAPAGVLVNTVSVGVVATDRVRERWAAAGSPPYPEWSAAEAARRGIALGRLAAPQEVADVVVFLLSRPASYLTGSVVDVAGGYGLPLTGGSAR